MEEEEEEKDQDWGEEEEVDLLVVPTAKEQKESKDRELTVTDSKNLKKGRGLSLRKVNTSIRSQKRRTRRRWGSSS